MTSKTEEIEQQRSENQLKLHQLLETHKDHVDTLQNELKATKDEFLIQTQVTQQEKAASQERMNRTEMDCKAAHDELCQKQVTVTNISQELNTLILKTSQHQLLAQKEKTGLLEKNCGNCNVRKVFEGDART